MATTLKHDYLFLKMTINGTYLNNLSPPTVQQVKTFHHTTGPIMQLSLVDICSVITCKRQSVLPKRSNLSVDQSQVLIDVRLRRAQVEHYKGPHTRRISRNPTRRENFGGRRHETTRLLTKRRVKQSSVSSTFHLDLSTHLHGRLFTTSTYIL